MFTHKGRPGQRISDAAKEAISLAESVTSPVTLEFNDIEITVTRSMSVPDVVADYHQQFEEHRSAYLESPEYKERQRQAEVKERERKSKLAAVLSRAPAMMTIKDADAWEKWRANNTDGYGAAVMRYAETWARTMESMIAGGSTLASCAKDASHIADDEGITGFMYGAAVSVLATVWIHGDELRRWHNADYSVSEEQAKGGTVNPAVLTIGRTA